MAPGYKRFYYDIDDGSNDASIVVDEVLVLKKVITFTTDGNVGPSELSSNEIRVFKVNSVMELKNKSDRNSMEPLNWLAGKLDQEKIHEISEFIDSMNYLSLDYRIMAITELKLNSLRKVVGDKGFVNEEDGIPCTMPVMTCCCDGIEFKYKDVNDELKRYFGKFFIIDNSGYILSAAYIKQPEAPNPFNLYALAAANMLGKPIQNVNVCELSDIKFDDMLCIYKENAFFDPNTIILGNANTGYYRGFLISNIEKVDSTELDKHFSYRIKGRFVVSNSYNFEYDISHGLDIGSAIDLRVNKNKSLVTLELGDIDDVKRVHANDFKLGATHFLERLFYVKVIEWCDGEKCEDPIIWPVDTVYRQFIQFDRIRRKAIDDCIDNLSNEELANIGPDDKLFCVE